MYVVMFGLSDFSVENKHKEDNDGIGSQNLMRLERLKQSQRQDYLHVGTGQTHCPGRGKSCSHGYVVCFGLAII